MALTDLVSWISYVHLGVLLGLLIGVCWVGVWRLYFSPIAHVPGPRLAALTWAYEFYYDIVLGGQFPLKIIELHKQYGPIVRINPCEVHVGDPDLYPQVDPIATEELKDHGNPLATLDHEYRRPQRAVPKPFFTTKKMRKLQPAFQEKTKALLNPLHQCGRTPSSQYSFSAFPDEAINNDFLATPGAHLRRRRSRQRVSPDCPDQTRRKRRDISACREPFAIPREVGLDSCPSRDADCLVNDWLTQIPSTTTKLNTRKAMPPAARRARGHHARYQRKASIAQLPEWIHNRPSNRCADVHYSTRGRRLHDGVPPVGAITRKRSPSRTVHHRARGLKPRTLAQREMLMMTVSSDFTIRR